MCKLHNAQKLAREAKEVTIRKIENIKLIFFLFREFMPTSQWKHIAHTHTHRRANHVCNIHTKINIEQQTLISFLAEYYIYAMYRLFGSANVCLMTDCVWYYICFRDKFMFMFCDDFFFFAAAGCCCCCSFGLFICLCKCVFLFCFFTANVRTGHSTRLFLKMPFFICFIWCCLNFNLTV